MRQLASIQKIKTLTPVTDSDNLLLATMYNNAWKCVVNKKDNLQIDQLIVYFEIDSILPKIDAFSFMEARNYKVKIAKFRKQISEGLIMPINILPVNNYKENQDVTELLGVTKYEPDLQLKSHNYKPKNIVIKYLLRYKLCRNMYYKIVNNNKFPNDISKSDETRIQNLTTLFENNWKNTDGWSISEKLDGSSATFILKKQLFFSIFKVCSRNIHLKKNINNIWWNIANKYQIKNTLKKVPFNVAIQGEIIGPNIQKNIYQLSEIDFFIFTIKNLNNNTFLNNHEIANFCDLYGFKHVPYLNMNYTIPNDINELITLADGKSVLNNKISREGLVIRKNNQSFKIISQKYLLKNDTE